MKLVGNEGKDAREDLGWDGVDGKGGVVFSAELTEKGGRFVNTTGEGVDLWTATCQ